MRMIGVNLGQIASNEEFWIHSSQQGENCMKVAISSEAMVAVLMYMFVDDLT